MLKLFLTRISHAAACQASQVSRNNVHYGLRVQHHLFNNCRYFTTDLATEWPESVKKILVREGITEPTKIQSETIPIVMQNKNLVGIARTGSGKTLAFVLPAIMRILKDREGSMEDSHSSTTETNTDHERSHSFHGNMSSQKPPTCLILAPTRELASQTTEVIQKFGSIGIRAISLVGGASRSVQLNNLGTIAYDFYVATPGRLNDFLENQLVNLSAIKYLVLDEADRMLDMGFEPQIRQILQRIPKGVQTLMWSATWPEEIQQLASEFLNESEKVFIDTSGELKANPNIKQIIEFCEPNRKLDLLLNHMDKFHEQSGNMRALIFVNRKHLANELMMRLMRHRIKAVALHGDKSQRQRDEALRLFKERFCNVMIATDVAARGLDIDDISHVINFDVPNNIEDYIHRIGRTARHEKSGTSVSFFTENDAGIAKKLISVLKQTDQEVPEKLQSMAMSGASLSASSRFRDGGRFRGNNQYRSQDNYRQMDRYGDRDDRYGDRYGDRGYGYGDRYGGRGNRYGDRDGGRNTRYGFSPDDLGRRGKERSFRDEYEDEFGKERAM